ncbi:MAG: hybrid sensor histidine kinase/response regulator [Polaromonas sp.]
MKTNPLQLAENRILVEQLRLIYGNVSVSFLPMFPAILLLAWAISNPDNIAALVVWASTLSLTTAYAIFNARRRLKRGFLDSEAPSLVRKLVISMAIDGAAWGALAFGALGTTTPVGTIVVICVLAGVLGGTVGLLAPLLPVFIAFSIPLVGLTAAKLAQLGDPAYSAFSVIAVMYLLTLIAQTHNSSKATRAAIELRFENIELMQQTEAARRDAEQANTAKSKFLAAASHDLRQPIHAQGLFLDVLSRTPLNAQQRELVSNISATSAASADMLNTLLDFSRIEAGVVKPHIQPFLLQPLLNKIEREFEPQADAKGLAYRSRETDLLVQSDSALIELVLRNLVSNAIRYTEHGGLLVACRRRGQHAVLEVWDTGMGIAPEQQAEVFKEFHQLGNPERDRRKGLGLGLAIAQGLCRTLGHELSLQSQPQRGSVFRLALPIAQVMPHAPLSNVASTAAVPLQSNMMHGVHVLVIDDDEAVLSAMAQLLQNWGCEVDTASTIEQALVLAQLQPPEVLISDYRLRSQRTGAQAIAEVRSLLGKAVPALLITGDTAPERLREALSVGVPLLHKPLAPGDLHRALVELLGDRQALFKSPGSLKGSLS